MLEKLKEYGERFTNYFSHRSRPKISFVDRDGIEVPVDDEFLKKIQEGEKMPFPTEFARNATYISQLTEKLRIEGNKELSDKVEPSQDL